MPTIDSCSADGHDVGAIRTVYTGGNPIQEQLEILDAKTHTISYRLFDSTAMPMKGGYGTVSLERKEEKSTSITWVADAEEISEEAIDMVKVILTGFIQKSIGGLKQALAKPAEPLG